MSKLAGRIGFGRYQADEYYRIALDFFRKNRLTDAIQNINYALMLVPTSAEYLSARAFFYLEDGLLTECEYDLDAALRLNAYEMLANYLKGVLAYQLKDWKAARDYFLKAWSVDEKRPETQYYLGLACYRLGEGDAARRWMEGARVLYEKGSDKAHLRDAEKWLSEMK